MRQNDLYKAFKSNQRDIIAIKVSKKVKQLEEKNDLLENEKDLKRKLLSGNE